MSTRQVMPALCPACGARFSAPLDSIIDVGKAPNLKSRVLQGQINITQCPQCGMQGPVTAPFLYHDAEHELALVLMPNELGLHNNDQQRFIGDLTNALISSLPNEERKGYLINPQVFLSMQRLVEVVLQAEGVTPEMLEQQRARAQLLEKFLKAGNEEALRALVKEYDQQLDYEFFEMITASAQAAQANGQSEVAQALMGLRTVLADLSTGGREAVAQINAAMGLGETVTREDLLERLQTAESDEDFEVLVAAGRPLLDYAFFQKLTEQIDSASDDDTIARLKALRSRILDTTARQDEEFRLAVEGSTELLRDILQSEDAEAFAREHLEEFNDTFFAVLSANIQQARSEKREDLAEKLQDVGNVVVKLVEEKLPAEIRLLNQLLGASYPDDTRQLLLAQREAITDQFFQTLEGVIAEASDSGPEDVVNHLKQIQEQARSIAEGVASA